MRVCVCVSRVGRAVERAEVRLEEKPAHSGGLRGSGDSEPGAGPPLHHKEGQEEELGGRKTD